MFDSRIRKLRNQRQKTRKRQILRTAACIKHLEELHENYVLVPADKAGLAIMLLWYVNNITRKYLLKNLLITQEPLHIYVVVSQQRW